MVRKIKKSFLFLLVAVALTALLTACGGSSLGKEEKKMVGEWQMIGAILGDDVSDYSDGSLVVNKDGSGRIVIGGEGANFSKIEYVKTDEDGDKFFYVYSGSSRYNALFYVSSSGRDTFMVVLDSDFAVIFAR